MNNFWLEGDIEYKNRVLRRAIGLEPVMDQFKQFMQIYKTLWTRNMKILDVGCGCGHLYRLIQQDGLNYTGIDKEYEYIKAAKLIFKFTPANFVCHHIENFPMSDDEFDLIVCYQLLPFVDDYDVILNRLVNAGKKVIARLLIGEHTQIIRRYYDRHKNQFYTNYNIYGIKELNQYLADNTTAKIVQLIDDEFDYEAPYKDEWTTYTWHGKQVNGNIILPWKTLIIEK